eukprot:15404-Chlamydomonas_euryale.AAC.4
MATGGGMVGRLDNVGCRMRALNKKACIGDRSPPGTQQRAQRHHHSHPFLESTKSRHLNTHPDTVNVTLALTDAITATPSAAKSQSWQRP